MWSIIVLGAAACTFSAARLPLARLDLRFLILALITLGIGSRLSVRVPRVRGQITVSDTFLFLTLLLFDGEAAIVLAALEGLCTSLRVTSKKMHHLFNASGLALTYFVTVWVIRFCFGSPILLTHHAYSEKLIMALCLMALIQYVTNTSMIAGCLALKANERFWPVWKGHFLYTSITYFAGASAAGIIARLVETAGFFAVIATTPIIAIVYFTYRTYLNSVETKMAQIEQAERHVEELSRHIAEQQRISQELQHSREHFRHAAFHDALTGLPNRTLLLDHLKLAIERARRRADHLFAVLFIDLDRFKNINDSLGHSTGDRLLIALARRLEGCLRPMDTVARLGGDEFAILLDGLEDARAAISVAERIQNELMQSFNLNGHEVYTTASIGIALSATGYEQPENVLRDADTAMYRAKENGKARHELFDTVMHARAVALLKLENDLRRAVERSEFVVYYQPVVSLETGEIKGFEALLRWHHPERGLVAPTEFVSLAEETGLIFEIGRWVLQEACQQLRRLQKLAPRALTISVNLSSKQFNQPHLIDQIKQALAAAQIAPHCLQLEITESVVMENAETATAMLMQLRALGVQLSIDDFGTGYSSLSYLHRFPVSTLKIDRSFVTRMGAGDENAEIVRTIVTLANNLGMEVIAEGVETEAQLAHLRELNCAYGQGYLFSRPVEGERAAALVKAPAHPHAETPPANLGDESLLDPDTISTYIN
ncbi:MAG TPA: EAL domain-containing protein [Pyrinomonadaceae bacterium]|jgi:diguanylate cyclase (GGDEF)-like protein